MKPLSRELIAGPLRVELEEGGLRYVRLGNREILRRIYVAVRDADWGTVPFEIVEQTVREEGEEGAKGFSVELLAEHRRGSLHFRWRGLIRGDAKGTIRFEMNGEALSHFKRNRIGLCVLHPIDECVDANCRVETADGRTVESRFPHLISPHQPFFDIRAFSHEVQPGLRAEVRFEGEVFEMEDQRNWGDASFKIYSTPLSLPRPVSLGAGTRVRQAVTLRLLPAPSQERAIRRGGDMLFSVDWDAAKARPLPKLGVTLVSRIEPLTARERSRLAALRLAHLRIEITPSAEDSAWAIERAVREAEALGLPLELALRLTDTPADELRRFAAAFGSRRMAIARTLLLPLRSDVTPPTAVGLARPILGALGAGACIGTGASSRFTEVNRNRHVVEGADAVAFPFSPQVHMTDDLTLVENLASVPWIAATARSFSGERPLILSPVTLKQQPRMAARGETQEASPGGGALPSFVDVRQTSLFAGGWTACHVGAIARSGFASATYYQATGWLGLMYGEAGSRHSDVFSAQPGEVYPLYHALADFADYQGGDALATHCSDPLAVEGVALRIGGRMRVILANFTAQEQRVRLEMAGTGGVRMRQGFIKRLDAGSLAQAMRAPEDFRAAVASESLGQIVLLPPHGMARVDWT